MKCPGCGLYHPPHYDKCVSCGSALSEQDPINEAAGASVTTTEKPAAFDVADKAPESLRRSKNVKATPRNGFATTLGIVTAALVLLISAGATIFFLTKPPDDQRLYDEGQKELQNGQYAFAVKSLNEALALRPKEAKVYLALARAYVGVDQVEKAWDCISQAQQLGAGVVSEPALASDLANFYRQHSRFERAIELLRPLAKANIEGKKAELADLDALWGDEALRAGNVDQALRCWEEVKDLHEGSRYGEAEARLATIYQKLADSSASNNDDGKALGYLNKLNNIAQNSRNYEMAAEIYERSGELELAIDQLRKAVKISGRSPLLEKKLSDLLSRRGKELLDEGNTEAGYGYLQQAKTINPDNAVPLVALRNLQVEPSSKAPSIAGEVWNPTEGPINSLKLKVELFDTTTSRTLWSKEQSIVDEFVPPLGSKESKHFDMESEVPVKVNGLSEFRVYLDGSLYKSYPIGKKDKEKDKDKKTTATAKAEQTSDKDLRYIDERAIPTSALKPMPLKPMPSVAPTVAPGPLPPAKSALPAKPDVAPTPGTTPAAVPDGTTPAPPKGTSAEEKTMKDLEP